MQTGEYDYIQQMKPDQYERLRRHAGRGARVAKPYGWVIWVLNLKQGLDARTSGSARPSRQPSTSSPPMLAAMGHKDFFRLDPGLFFVEQAWHSKAGAALYNQRDKDKARRLAQGGRATRASRSAGS